jgi:transcriptional regulator of acetoin/glycerol metabolism
LKRLAAEEATGELCLDQTLTDALVRHQYRLHHRELERILRLASRHAVDRELGTNPEVLAELELPVVTEAVSEAVLRLALAECKTASEAAKRLGLPSRFALYRLMKKLGVEQGQAD